MRYLYSNRGGRFRWAFISGGRAAVADNVSLVYRIACACSASRVPTAADVRAAIAGVATAALAPFATAPVPVPVPVPAPAATTTTTPPPDVRRHAGLLAATGVAAGARGVVSSRPLASHGPAKTVS